MPGRDSQEGQFRTGGVVGGKMLGRLGAGDIQETWKTEDCKSP